MASDYALIGCSGSRQHQQLSRRGDWGEGRTQLMIHNKQPLDQFLRAARFRSEQNRAALDLLLKARMYGIAIGLLRQEVDTFVRVVYLESLDDHDAARLIQDFAKGKKWGRMKGGRLRRITDSEMVKLAQVKYFWVEKAYQFACKLIHLSDFHDYQSVDPFTTIPTSDKRTIMNFLRDYHGYRDNDIDLPRFIELLPKVMVKIRGKVEEYCDALERRLDRNHGSRRHHQLSRRGDG